MSRILSEVDFEQPGKHQGFLRVPHSVHRSAYGWIPVPIVSIKNGQGPVVLLMAGNHGDEYEGQVALCNLVQRLEPSQLNGQLIILPMANYPAARAGLRTSPLDQGNLNRSFPGNPNGSPTEMIAHYIESVLLSRSHYLLDIHSGGSSLLYRPTMLMAKSKDPERQQKNIELLEALNFPVTILYPEQAEAGYASSAALRQNVIAMTAEMAGGGSVNHDAVNLLESSIERFLGYLEIITPPDVAKGKTEFFENPSQDYYIYARSEGVFEPLVEIKEQVTTGQVVGLIHHPETPWEPPHEVRVEATARVVCKRVPARVERGDCLYELATPLGK